jgi:V8-like Glu-specific endopeptidase
MKLDDAELTALNRTFFDAFPVDGDLDLVATAASMGGDWLRLKNLPNLELAWLNLLKRANANKKLLKLIEAAVDRSPEDDQLLHFRELVEPLKKLDTDLGMLEKVVFQGVRFADVGPWIEKLNAIRRTICLVKPRPDTTEGCGTGFLIDRDIVLTNWHVAMGFWSKKEESKEVRVLFDFETGAKPKEYKLAMDWTLPWSADNVKAYDFALLRLNGIAAEEVIEGRPRGVLSLSRKSEQQIKALLEDKPPLVILQHPLAEPLKMAFGKVTRSDDVHFWYQVNTAGGSSGSPCLTQELEVIGLHHAATAGDENEGIIASLIRGRIDNKLDGRGEIIHPFQEKLESVITPAIVAVEGAGRKAVIVQTLGKEGSLTQARARLVREKLIEPACRSARFEPIVLVEEPQRWLEPVVSPLHGEPLVIADLGASPWNSDVLLEIGFRLATDKATVLLMDRPINQAAVPASLRHLLNSRILEIDKDEPSQSLEMLREMLQKCDFARPQFWYSQYAYVDYRVRWGKPAESVYTFANEIAAKLYGYERPDQMIGKPLGEVATQIYGFMPNKHREEFLREQTLLAAKIMNAESDESVRATVNYPLWFKDGHADKDFRNKAYLPLLVQHKKEAGSPDLMMRTVYVDISDWCVEGLKNLPDSIVLEVPELYRLKPKKLHHVMIPYDKDQEPYMKLLLRNLTPVFRCWVAPKGADQISQGADQIAPDQLIQQIAQSQILAIPIGPDGLGKWMRPPTIVDAIKSFCEAGGPHVLLILPDFGQDDESWRDNLSEPFRTLFFDSLYLPMPPEIELKENMRQNSMGKTFVGRLFKLIRKLLDT